MAFNLNQFRSSFWLGEPASPTTYEVFLQKTPAIAFTLTSAAGNTIDRSVAFEKDAVFRCESCSMPGKNLTYANRLTYGPIRKVASNSIYTDVVFSYIVSEEMYEKSYFSAWQSAIIDNNTTNDVSYYKDYIGEILIKKYSKSGKPALNILLEEAYPIGVSEIPLSWNSTNDYIRVSVTMAYRKWREV